MRPLVCITLLHAIIFLPLATGYDFLAHSVQKQKCIISHCKLWFAERTVIALLFGHIRFRESGHPRT